jgi:peptidoglycan hydrolase CwlO-like protein
MMDSTTETLIELNSKLERLINGIDTLAANQERMGDDISKIKEAVYNPDEGLYARLRALEQWKETQSRVQWLVTSGVIMLIGKMLWETMMAGGVG